MAGPANMLTDLQLVERDARFRPVYAVGSSRRLFPGRPAPTEDLATAAGYDNLAQALIVRLLTPRGELAPLGHPEYGSRVHELIGEPNNAAHRALLKLFILEALAAERRIESNVGVTIEPLKGTFDAVAVTLEVKPVGAASRVTIGPFTLELGT